MTAAAAAIPSSSGFKTIELKALKEHSQAFFFDPAIQKGGDSIIIAKFVCHFLKKSKGPMYNSVDQYEPNFYFAGLLFRLLQSSFFFSPND